MHKNVIDNQRIFLDKAMSGTIISSVCFIKHVDSVGIDLSWTGEPVGSFSVQVSNSFKGGTPPTGGPLQAGSWTSLPLNPTPQAVGSSTSGWFININQMSGSYMRVVFTSSTATGVLNAYFSGKSLG